MYVHVPFCAARCGYCAFATWTDRHHLHGRYTHACVAEIARARLEPASSVFFGGGTPSLLDPQLLVAVLEAIPRQRGAEVTVECNPDTVTSRLLAVYRDAGVTRLSFGVQSMAPHVLASLGRSHDPASVQAASRLAVSLGFSSWNLDLIYGGAGESLDDWRHTLETVLALDPPHVSAYALTVEAGTPLSREPALHPDDDDLAEKYEIADQVLGASGRPWYEVSNWARPGHECAHNRLYWTGGAYRGIGCAAHSFDGARRWWNVRTPDRYVQLVERGEDPAAAGETLDADARRLESLALRLRTREGVPAAAFPPGELADIDGLVDLDGDRVVLTCAGRLLANEVALRLG